MAEQVLRILRFRCCLGAQVAEVKHDAGGQARLLDFVAELAEERLARVSPRCHDWWWQPGEIPETLAGVWRGIDVMVADQLDVAAAFIGLQACVRTRDRSTVTLDPCEMAADIITSPGA